jgi:integrase
MAYAGLAETEVIELLLEDLNFQDDLISVSSSENPASTRQIPISEELLALLERRPTNSSKYLFPNIQANSKPWYPSSFNSELQKRLPEDIKPSDLTNSFT